MKFSRELFTNWDVNHDATISEDEVIKPLVALGLVPDHKFARKIWKALKPRTQDQQVRLSYDEFTRIFN